MGLIWRILLNALALVLVSWLFEGISFAAGSRGVIAALWAGLVLGVVNVTIKPLIKLLTLPVNILTLGLFGLLVNALMLKVVDWLSPGFEVHGFFAAFFGAIVLAVISSVLNLLFE
ncbi:phage holin family protein [Effusibacillus pohliae]|uniref:phage holin family protein n=1 Tax=Effusibacillus pohliae TaxID=232270 RepID=UPI000370AFF0|nr:phage holin family protein [Effusibacillus pohliae]